MVSFGSLVLTVNVVLLVRQDAHAEPCVLAWCEQHFACWHGLSSNLRRCPSDVSKSSHYPFETSPVETHCIRCATQGGNIGFFQALLFVAAYRLPGGVAAVLGAAQPLLVAVLAVPLLGDRLRPRAVLLGLLGVAGVALIVISGPVALDPVGVAAGLAGTACMGTGVVLTKRWGRPVPVLAFTGWQLTAAACCCCRWP